jgi:hypothetical protein
MAAQPSLQPTALRAGQTAAPCICRVTCVEIDVAWPAWRLSFTVILLIIKREEYKMILGKDLLLPAGIEARDVSDGYHTFDELYEFRKVYNAALFNEWARQKKYEVHKSTKHFEGDECFGGEFFIVVAILPGGQISNHYEMKDWDLFHIPAYDKVLYKYDGHTAKDVLERLRNITSRFSGAQETAPAEL